MGHSGKYARAQGRCLCFVKAVLYIGEVLCCTRPDAAIATSSANVRADAAADHGVDSESCLCSELGDSHDSVGEAAGVAEDDAVAASGRVQRHTYPVYKTALTE